MSDVPFQDVDAERVVIAGILRHGRDAYVDADAYVDVAMFSDETNQAVYRCIQEFYAGGDDRKLDPPSLQSTAKKLKLGSMLAAEDERRYVRALYNMPVELPTVGEHSAKLLKLAMGRELYSAARRSCQNLKGITGDESFGEITSLAETPFFEALNKLNSDGHDTKQIAGGMREWLDHVIANPRENVGIPTPFAAYNKAIGGGFRRRSISMIGARPKCGKTILCDTFALHVAGTLKIPVLNLDTEMTDEEHWVRMLGFLTGIPNELIETGKLNAKQADMLREKVAWLETIPYYYRSVIDEGFEEQVAAMRRWVVKTVGTDDTGRTNDCLVVYDYLQLTDAGDYKGDFKEHQMLGFMMVTLTRFAKKYDVPVLSLLQLNRDGIDKETTAAASGSDRIIWKCGNFTILKDKSEDEIAEDGPDEGVKKLVPLIARHGKGGRDREYISIKFDGDTTKMVEGKTRSELIQSKGRKPSVEKGFPVDVDDDACFAP